MLSTMKNIVFAVIVTGFLMKSYRKLREKPESNPGTKEEVYRRMKVAHEVHSKLERILAEARAASNRMDAISTPMDGDLLSSIDAVQQMAPGRFT